MIITRIKRGYMEGVYEVIQQSPRFKRVVLTDTSYEKLTSGRCDQLG